LRLQVLQMVLDVVGHGLLTTMLSCHQCPPRLPDFT
jgi:hypothetical protein